MARWFSNLTAVRRNWRGGGVYMVVAVVVFAGIVFLLFRGHSSGPQGATASNIPPESRAIPEPAPAQPALSETTLAEPPAQPVTETFRVVESVAAVQAPPTPPARTESQPTPAVQAPAQPVDAGNPQAEALVAEALSLLRTQPGEVIEVRNRLNRILLMPLGPQQRQDVKSEMAKLADKWLFGPATFPSDTLCDTYMVRSGDLLDIIGRRLKVPYEILMQINNIPRPQALQAGKALKVVKGPFHAKVCRSTFTLDLYLQDMYVRSFTVGLGKAGYETPTGLWRVQNGGKLIAPTWTDPDSGHVYKSTDPDYPLGSRWIALEGVSGAAVGRTGFAIHGTKEPEQIGTAGSRGCIRMYNGDAVLIYNMLVPLYSQVEVFDMDK